MTVSARRLFEITRYLPEDAEIRCALLENDWLEVRSGCRKRTSHPCRNPRRCLQEHSDFLLSVCSCCCNRHPASTSGSGVTYCASLVLLFVFSSNISSCRPQVAESRLILQLRRVRKEICIASMRPVLIR